MQKVKIIEGGVCAAKGFRAAGVGAEIKYKGRNDVALIVADEPCVAAAVFTTNQVAAAPVVYDREIVKGGKVQAILANSGCANACTGEGGMHDAELSALATAGELGISPKHVLVASTGVIGRRLPMDRLLAGMKDAATKLGSTAEHGLAAEKAVMTTDTRPKQAAARVKIGGKTVTVGGMSKGSGMIEPNMATMLGFVTTDAAISRAMLKRALGLALNKSFNRVVIDGDSYALNDSRHYSLARLGNRRALVVNGSGDERDGFFLTRALRPAGVAFSYVMPETKDWAGLMNTSDLSPYAMVLVCNPPEMPSSVVSSLRRYVESGGQLVLFPGGQGGLKAEALRELCGLGAEGLSVSDTGMLEERPLRVTTEASWGELPSRLSRMASPPWPLVVRRRLVLKAGETGAFLRFEGTDGGEFMLRRALGAGEVLVCAVSANRDWSDLPLTPFYFVLMQELSRHGAGYRHRPLETVVGGELALACRGDISSVTALKGQEPSGRTVELPCAAAARGGLLVVRGFRTPGIFRVELPGGESRQVAVNLPDSESRLELWPPESLTGTLFTEVPSFWSADESELRRQSSQASRMRPLSPWLLLAAFALSMAEVLYANVRSRRQGQPRLLGRLLREGGGVA